MHISKADSGHSRAIGKQRNPKKHISQQWYLSMSNYLTIDLWSLNKLPKQWQVLLGICQSLFLIVKLVMFLSTQDASFFPLRESQDRNGSKFIVTLS